MYRNSRAEIVGGGPGVNALCGGFQLASIIAGEGICVHNKYGT